MPLEQQIERAREIVDLLPDPQYQLTPAKHAESLRQLAADDKYKPHYEDITTLARKLDRSRIDAMAAEYQVQDKRATVNQALFFNKSAKAQKHNFLMTVWATCLLAVGPLMALMHGQFAFLGDHAAPDGAIPKVLVPLFMLGSLTSGVLAEIELKQIRSGNFLEIFKQAREEAETIRIRYFELVAQTLSGGSSFGNLLQMEYIRRFLLQDQMNYYKHKATTHSKDSMTNMGKTSQALAAIVILEGLSGIMGMQNANLTVISGAVLILKAHLDRTSSEEALQQYRGNAERYEYTRKALNRIWASLDVVRSHLASGNPNTLQAFIRAVTMPMKNEQEQWNSDFELRFAELESLEKNIAESAGKRSG